MAASVLAFAATTGVAAESLAHPRDTALERAAAVYVRYREDVAAIEATPFNSAETTREAHRRLSAHNAESLSAGWVAYAALVAADTPAFRKALEDEVSSKKKSQAFYAALAKNPAYPRELDCADEAVSRVLAMTTQDASRFTSLGEGHVGLASAWRTVEQHSVRHRHDRGFAILQQSFSAMCFCLRLGVELQPLVVGVTSVPANHEFIADLEQH